MKSVLCFFASLAFLVILPSALGRKYEICETAQIMEATGFARDALPDWMCLIQSESGFNSSAIGGPNTNGSFDWGLFQINDGYWCTVEGVGNDCNINCSDLVDDDIDDDLACVKIIFARHGFTAWHGWTNKCQGELISVDDCFSD